MRACQGKNSRISFHYCPVVLSFQSWADSAVAVATRFPTETFFWKREVPLNGGPPGCDGGAAIGLTGYPQSLREALLLPSKNHSVLSRIFETRRNNPGLKRHILTHTGVRNRSSGLGGLGVTCPWPAFPRTGNWSGEGGRADQCVSGPWGGGGRDARGLGAASRVLTPLHRKAHHFPVSPACWHWAWLRALVMEQERQGL